jgi:hypothetical protein
MIHSLVHLQTSLVGGKNCTIMAQRMVDELTSDVHELDEEKTKYALCKL